MRYLILILLFFSELSFAAGGQLIACVSYYPRDRCQQYAREWVSNDPNVIYGCANAGPITMPWGDVVPGGRLCRYFSCSAPTTQHVISDDSAGSTGSCKCPDPKVERMVNGALQCVDPDSSSASSGSSSSAGSCPAGQVKNLETNSCEPKVECVYPQLYDSYSNACRANPLECAIGATPNPLSPGTCIATEPTSCPSGWTLTSDNLNCSPNPVSSAASSPPSSSPPTSSPPSSLPPSSEPPTSSPPTSSTPSSSGGGSGGDGSGGTGGTGGGTGGTGGGTGGDSGGGSGSSSGSNSSWTPHAGYGNWIPVSENSTCPNKYKDNAGQWWCSGANSGSNSSGKGECDPTAKDYLACISSQLGAGSGSSAAGGNSSACNPQSSDFAACSASVNGSGKMKELGDKFNEDMDKERDKLNKAIDDDLSNFGRDGVPFKNQFDGVRGVLMGFLPVSTACIPPEIEFFERKYRLDCMLFNVLKQGFGWALSIWVAWSIFQLAIRPVNR